MELCSGASLKKKKGEGIISMGIYTIGDYIESKRALKGATNECNRHYKGL